LEFSNPKIVFLRVNSPDLISAIKRSLEKALQSQHPHTLTEITPKITLLLPFAHTNVTLLGIYFKNFAGPQITTI